MGGAQSKGFSLTVLGMKIKGRKKTRKWVIFSQMEGLNADTSGYWYSHLFKFYSNWRFVEHNHMYN